MKSRDNLERLRQWAAPRAASGCEPPWAGHLYARLAETISALLAGMAATGRDLDTPAEATAASNVLTLAETRRAARFAEGIYPATLLSLPAPACPRKSASATSTLRGFDDIGGVRECKRIQVLGDVMHESTVLNVQAPALSSHRTRRIKWRYASPIILIHLIALLACLPWFFSWTGVVLAVLGQYVFGAVGMNVGYHRLLTHRSFACPKWLERSLAILGACCLEESPTVWAAWHRLHHHASDKEHDPHSPLASFMWGHVGWLMVKSDNADAGPLKKRYAPDLIDDPFYLWLEAKDNWIKVGLACWASFFIVGIVAVVCSGGATPDAIQFGSSLVIWGAAVRTVLVWHITWSVNSVTHLWGYRNYETPDNSRNNVLVGLLAGGEGWHNNHHAAPSSARHGHYWWELDVAWLTIRVLMAVGLATKVNLPSPKLAETFRPRAAPRLARISHTPFAQ